MLNPINKLNINEILNANKRVADADITKNELNIYQSLDNV